jgi:hypothetical protein
MVHNCHGVEKNKVLKVNSLLFERQDRLYKSSSLHFSPPLTKPLNKIILNSIIQDGVEQGKGNLAHVLLTKYS